MLRIIDQVRMFILIKFNKGVNSMKRQQLVGLLLILILLSIPGLAFAQIDAYGLNDKALIFEGSLENWEALLKGELPQPVDMQATDVPLVHRKWNQAFAAAFFGGQPWQDGAWLLTHGYIYLSGAQQGWTWHVRVKLVYSSNPVPGSFPEGNTPGLYVVEYREYLTDPNGNEQQLADLCTSTPSLGKGYYIHLK